MTKNLFAAACLLVAACSSAANASDLWHVTFESNWLGPMEAFVDIRQDADQLRGVNQSGAVSVIQGLPGDHTVDDGLMVFEATANPDQREHQPSTEAGNHGSIAKDDKQVPAPGDQRIGGNTGEERAVCAKGLAEQTVRTQCQCEPVLRVTQPTPHQDPPGAAAADQHGEDRQATERPA